MAFSYKLEHEDGTPADPPTFDAPRVTDRRLSALLDRGRGARLRCAAACGSTSPPNLPHAYPGDTG